MAERRARLITLEGLDGAGKSTQLEALAAHIRSHQRRLRVTREPGGSAIGERIRALLLEDDAVDMDAMTELLLLFAARAEHVASVIRPALVAGCDVLCDRFTDSSYAYQGAGRQLGFRKIATLETMVQRRLRPHRVLLLDCPVATALARCATDRFSSEVPAFFERVRKGYLKLAQEHPQRYRVIDATQPAAAVQQQLRQALEGLW